MLFFRMRTSIHWNLVKVNLGGVMPSFVGLELRNDLLALSPVL